MAATKKQLADELGVTKQTVTNHIQRLGLSGHVTREGNVDMVDDFACSALADAIGTDKTSKGDAPDGPSNVADAQKIVISNLEAELRRKTDEYESRLSKLEAELEATRGKLLDAQDKLIEAAETNGRLSGEIAEIAKRQQIIAATPWWRRWSLAAKLLGSGDIHS